MGIKLQRKPFKIGSSVAITLPAPWLNFWGDRAKTVTLIGGDVLLIVPQGLEDRAEKIMREVQHNFDEHEDNS